MQLAELQEAVAVDHVEAFWRQEVVDALALAVVVAPQRGPQ